MPANTIRHFFQNHQWHPSFAILVILFFPLFIEYSYSDFVREAELNSRLGWFLLLLATVWVIRKPIALHALAGIFILPGSMDILYASTFGGVFTTSSLEAAALTDSAEAAEFFRTYAGFENLGLLGMYVGSSIYLLRNSKILSTKDRWFKTVATLGTIMLAVVIHHIVIKSKYHDTFPGFMGTLPSYLLDRQSITKQIADRKQFVTGNTVTASLDHAEQAQTYVIVIGESLTRTHLSIYGYERETTPRLAQLKNELTVFDNTICSHTQTQPSLRLALTQANADNKLATGQALSIVDMANKAGFKTWWISNQQPLRSTISAVANMADEAHYVSNDYHGVQVRRFDELLLPYVETALQDGAEKKAIFVHLMGSHLQYDNRYPDEFAVFGKNDNRSVKAYQWLEKHSDYINSYDNSVLYTDWIVTEIIAKLKQAPKESLAGLLFFSDHGEEVYDTLDFVGHRPDSISPAMVEIPFITWTSEGYRQQRPEMTAMMQQQRQAPFMLDNAFVAMNAFMGISSTALEEKNNLFSSHYQPTTRVVYNKDYDKEVRQNRTLLSKSQ